ncbi:hypothetical protein BKA64DRAFT_635941 [Cadophora sp. MPI-SDFR-AT-0126]|nr:hypothetical protein BKA64DRAFT_635941 [Leotiomycetes sp. MPI-SDFR-AT-0126]
MSCSPNFWWVSALAVCRLWWFRPGRPGREIITKIRGGTDEYQELIQRLQRHVETSSSKLKEFKRTHGEGITDNGPQPITDQSLGIDGVDMVPFVEYGATSFPITFASPKQPCLRDEIVREKSHELRWENIVTSGNLVTKSCNRFHSIKTLPEYKEALRRAYPFGGFDEPKSEEENLGLNTAFFDYSRYYNDQAAIERSGEVIACLCSALMRMPNIERITISPNFEYELDDELDNYSKYFLEPNPAYNEAFLLMARVLSLTGANIRELDIERDDNDRGDGADGALFRGMSHLNLSLCCDAFRGLRNITITANETDINGWRTGNLARILSGATDLERLRIRCSDGMFHISTRYILGTTEWSRLTSLDFYSTTFDQGDFLDVLRRHSGTLKNIDLFCVQLTNGSWIILLEGMKSSLSLQHITIEDPYEEDRDEEIYLNDHALTNYLLGDGPNRLSIEYLLNL